EEEAHGAILGGQRDQIYRCVIPRLVRGTHWTRAVGGSHRGAARGPFRGIRCEWVPRTSRGMTIKFGAVGSSPYRRSSPSIRPSARQAASFSKNFSGPAP